MFKINRHNLKKELNIWRKAALPGLTVILIVILTRLTGSLQLLEWTLFDTFLSSRPAEKLDERIVIVGINEDDIQKQGSYPIADKNIAELLKTLQQYKPRAIGLDIFKNVPVDPGNLELNQIFQQSSNIFGIEKILPPFPIKAPASLSESQIGFADIIADRDGKYRRYLLWTPQPDNLEKDKYSLALRLTEAYLAKSKINIETGINDPDTIKFKSLELPRFLSNSGGYLATDAGGLQILLNFRNGKDRFRTLSMHDIKIKNFQPEWISDRIILIGITAPSVPDFVDTSAIADVKPYGQIYGVEFHAQASSQIISAVLDNRPLIKTWLEGWEYIWIIFWGLIPIFIGRWTQSVWLNIIAVSCAGFLLLGVSYILLWCWGLWIPVAPGLLILAINGLGLSAFAFYKHDQALKSKINERQQTIRHTFNLIHSGPLQTLAHGLRHLREQDIPHEQLVWQFESLNQEIRDIGDYLELEALTQEETIRLGSGLKLDLHRPLHELFYEVYTSTLERNDLEYFKNIKIKTRQFEQIINESLSLEIKQELCLFLEEALCNVGKHAQGVKHVQAIGKNSQGWYILTIQDNGAGIRSLSESKGTKHCRNLANKLGGSFHRKAVEPKGTLCEIKWQLTSHQSSYQIKIQQLKSGFLSLLKKIQRITKHYEQP